MTPVEVAPNQLHHFYRGGVAHLCGLGEDADLRLMDLHPTRRLFVRDGEPLDLEHRLGPKSLWL